MEHQDWTPVVVRAKRSSKTTSPVNKDASTIERVRLAKLENNDGVMLKKTLDASCIQDLIRKRIEKGLTQDKADSLCAFPKHTFREIEAGRLVPLENQKSKIYREIGASLKTVK
jgi:hypothetical protein